LKIDEWNILTIINNGEISGKINEFINFKNLHWTDYWFLTTLKEDECEIFKELNSKILVSCEHFQDQIEFI
jgi:hypothetical protein